MIFLWVILGCLLATALFSAAEMAFVAANRLRLRHLAEGGHGAAARYLEAFSRPQRGGIRAIALEDGDEVMTARLTAGQREVVLSTKLGLIIRFSEEEVRPMGRAAAGVKGIELEEGDQVIAAEVMQEGVTILTVTERGYGKRTPLEEYRLQGRAGKGIIDIKTGGRNGNVVGGVQARPGDDILLVTTKGKIIRMHAADISAQGRNTWGVRLIDLEADDRVGSIARVEAEQLSLIHI